MCPFCGAEDPYEYADIGIGHQAVAVTCCEEGVAFFQDGIAYEDVAAVIALRYAHPEEE